MGLNAATLGGREFEEISLNRYSPVADVVDNASAARKNILQNEGLLDSSA